MSNKTNIGLVEYVKSKLNVPTIYMLSGIGRRLTESMIQSRIAQGDAHTIRNQGTIRSGMGKYCFDCVGLIKGYLWELAPGVINYVGSQDQNVLMMYNASHQKGLMASMPDIPGILVMTEDLGHVGIYIGKENGINQYIECTPAWGAWGVTRSAASGSAHNRTWKYWCKYALVEYLPVGETTYQTHIQNVGDSTVSSDGQISGTTGKGLRVEAIIIHGHCTYRVHVQNIGWMEYVRDAWTGTRNKALRLEAIEIIADDGYTIEAEAHVANIGWMGIQKGSHVIIGTTGQSKAIEAVKIKVSRV